MASWIPSLLILSLLSHSILLIKCDVDDDFLLQGINMYRTARNLTALTTNDTAEDCLADEIVDTYSNRACTPTNSTTLPKFSDYPGVLARCGLTATNATGEGQILVACAPVSAQQQTLVLDTLTKNYATYLNSSQISAIGIGTEDNWAVLVLSYAPVVGTGTNTTTGGGGGGGGGTNTTTGPGVSSFPPPAGFGGSNNGASSSLAAMSPLVFAIICLFVLV